MGEIAPRGRVYLTHLYTLTNNITCHQIKTKPVRRALCYEGRITSSARRHV